MVIKTFHIANTYFPGGQLASYAEVNADYTLTHHRTREPGNGGNHFQAEWALGSLRFS